MLNVHPAFCTFGPGLLSTADPSPEHPLKCCTSRSGGETSLLHFGTLPVDQLARRSSRSDS